MLYKQQTQRLIQSYEGKVAWGSGDHEEALHEAIATAFAGVNEEGQAELYARIADAWDSHRDGMCPRKLWIGQIVNEFMSQRAGESAGSLVVHRNLNVPKAEAEEVPKKEKRK